MKEIILQERHWDELTADAADSVWAVFGTAVHAILEKYDDGGFHEEQFDVPVGASRVTGVVDSYDMERGTIADWKTASRVQGDERRLRGLAQAGHDLRVAAEAERA